MRHPRTPSRRPLRVAEILREELSHILAHDMRDPRLQSPWITITEVDVSPDLKNAKVFFSTLNPQADIPEMQTALQGAAGHLRSVLSKRLEGGYGVPALHFFHDTLIDESIRLDRLIDSALAHASADPENSKGKPQH